MTVKTTRRHGRGSDPVPPKLEPRPSVDFPKSGERVTSPEYALRVSVPAEAQGVEVAIDRGEWRACRPAVGYWWFDWCGYGNGVHEAVARFRHGDGPPLESAARRFVVALDGAADEPDAA